MASKGDKNIADITQAIGEDVANGKRTGVTRIYSTCMQVAAAVARALKSQRRGAVSNDVLNITNPIVFLICD